MRQQTFYQNSLFPLFSVVGIEISGIFQANAMLTMLFFISFVAVGRDSCSWHVKNEQIKLFRESLVPVCVFNPKWKLGKPIAVNVTHCYCWPLLLVMLSMQVIAIKLREKKTTKNPKRNVNKQKKSGKKVIRISNLQEY